MVCHEFMTQGERKTESIRGVNYDRKMLWTKQMVEAHLVYENL